MFANVITSKEVFAKRKAGALDEAYQMALNLVEQQPTDEWNFKALAWCLIDLCKREATANNTAAVSNYIQQLKSIKFSSPDDILSKQMEMVSKLSNPASQKLQQAKLVIAEEFHYSKKGREVNHYKLANKYIIIAPKKVSGLKEKLKGILPVAAAALGISAVIKLVTKTSGTLPTAMAEAALAPEAPSMAADTTMMVVNQQPDIAFWFLAGSVATMILYLIMAIINEKFKKT